MIRLNPKNTQKGFTLVEVIVVAVIVAAMAAVAVPLYLGYVNSSRVNAAANAAGSIASFCGACENSGGDLPAPGAVADSIVCTNVTTGNTSIQIPADISVELVASPRSVEARHVASDSTDPATLKTYNY